MTLRRHGWSGAPDHVLLNLPYLRLQQEMQLAAEAELEQQRRTLQNAAFIGWQVRDVVLAALGAKQRPAFAQYLTSMGLSDKPTKRRTQGALAPKGAGTENAARVRDAFKRDGIRKA